MRLTWFASLCLYISVITAQSQTFDKTFNPIFESPSHLFNGVIVGDDELVVQGEIRLLSGTPCGTIIKITKDGIPDPGFNALNGIQGQSYDMASQADGKILLSGIFTNDENKLRLLVRLNTDGSVDNSFNPSPNEDANGEPGFGYLYSVALQSNGKILVGGSFVNFDGIERRGLVRLNIDGSIDASFDAGLDFDLYRIAVQSDDKILVFGNNSLMRLNADGTADNSFSTVSFNGAVNAVDFQSDARIIVGGVFSEVNGSNANEIARINTNGTYDDTFFAPGDFSIFDIQDLKVSADDRVTAIGNFSKGVLRLTANGEIDPAFQVESGFNAQAVGTSPNLNFVALQTNGSAIVGGYFSAFDSSPRMSLARINEGGSLDASYELHPSGSPGIMEILPTPDGKVMVAGRFIFVNGQHTPGGVVRLNFDGSTDPTFDVSAMEWSSGYVKTIGLYPGGKMLLGGNFYVTPNGIPGTELRGLVTVTSDGDHDQSFIEFSGISAPWNFTEVSDLMIQEDGKVIIGGSFHQVNSIERKHLARLNTDGSVDLSFHTSGADYPDWIRELSMEEDAGKILILHYENGGVTPRVVELADPDGSPDPQPDVTGKFDNSFVHTAIFMPDERLLIGGGFSAFDNVASPGLVKISREGLLDETFTFQTEASLIQELLKTKTDKVLVGLRSDAEHPSALIVINEDGTLLPTEIDIQGDITGMATDGGDNFYISGTTLTVDGLVSGGLFRLNGGEVHDPSQLVAESSENNIALVWSDNATTSSVFEVQRSVNSNSDFRFHAYTSAPSFVDEVDLDRDATYYYRVRVIAIHENSAFSNEAFVKLPIITSVESAVTKHAITAYPNPFSKTFTLQNTSDEEMKASLLNYCGQEVLRMNVIPNGSVNVGGTLPLGLYILKVNQYGRQSLVKLIKE